MRTGPIRDPSNIYRRPDSWGSRDPIEEPAWARPVGRRGSWNDVVAQGVDLGYRVVEEQIRQGQRVAAQINRQWYDPGAIGNDIREVADRMLRYYADISALWFEFLGSIVGNTDFLRIPSGPARPRYEPSPVGVPVGAPTAVSIEVFSSRPTRTTLDVHPAVDCSRLSVQDLRASEPGKPPLTGVGFVPAPDGGLVLRIHVPGTQPPGSYTGAVIDRDTGEARGTLTVRLDSQPDPGVRFW